MSLEQYTRLNGVGRFPRVSGDEPGATMEDMQAAMFSPRERG